MTRTEKERKKRKTLQKELETDGGIEKILLRRETDEAC